MSNLHRLELGITMKQQTRNKNSFFTLYYWWNPIDWLQSGTEIIGWFSNKPGFLLYVCVCRLSCIVSKIVRLQSHVSDCFAGLVPYTAQRTWFTWTILANFESFGLMQASAVCTPALSQFDICLCEALAPEQCICKSRCIESLAPEK